MGGRNWKRVVPTSLIDAFRLCKDHARETKHLSVERIAELMGVTADALYKWLAIGAGYRDLRKLRALPDDTRAGLLESPEAKAALETGDREALRELIEDMATAHAKTKAQVEELQAEAEAHGKIISGKDTKINELDKRLKKAERRVATLEPDEALEGIRLEMAGFGVEIEALIANNLQPAFQAVTDHHAANGGSSDEALDGCLRQIEQRLRELREAFGLVAPLAAQWGGE